MILGVTVNASTAPIVGSALAGLCVQGLNVQVHIVDDPDRFGGVPFPFATFKGTQTVREFGQDAVLGLIDDLKQGYLR